MARPRAAGWGAAAPRRRPTTSTSSSPPSSTTNSPDSATWRRWSTPFSARSPRSGRVRSGGRVPTSRRELQILANSLGPDDPASQIASSRTSRCTSTPTKPHHHLPSGGVGGDRQRAGDRAVAGAVGRGGRRLRRGPSCGRSPRQRSRRTVATCARWRGCSPPGGWGGCWLPDEQTRALRRRLARRAQLVRRRRRGTNEVHAVLMRTLKARPPMSDAFGRGGRVRLAELELPADARETVDGCLRQIDFLDGEIAILERGIAEHALGSDVVALAPQHRPGARLKAGVQASRRFRGIVLRPADARRTRTFTQQPPCVWRGRWRRHPAAPFACEERPAEGEARCSWFPRCDSGRRVGRCTCSAVEIRPTRK